MPIDKGVFINVKEKIAIAIYVDDLLFIGLTEDSITRMTDKISESLKIQSLGELKDFLGISIKINRADKTLTLS